MPPEDLVRRFRPRQRRSRCASRLAETPSSDPRGTCIAVPVLLEPRGGEVPLVRPELDSAARTRLGPSGQSHALLPALSYRPDREYSWPSVRLRDAPG